MMLAVKYLASTGAQPDITIYELFFREHCEIDVEKLARIMKAAVDGNSAAG